MLEFLNSCTQYLDDLAAILPSPIIGKSGACPLPIHVRIFVPGRKHTKAKSSHIRSAIYLILDKDPLIPYSDGVVCVFSAVGDRSGPHFSYPHICLIWHVKSRKIMPRLFP